MQTPARNRCVSRVLTWQGGNEDVMAKDINPPFNEPKREQRTTGEQLRAGSMVHSGTHTPILAAFVLGSNELPVPELL